MKKAIIIKASLTAVLAVIAVFWFSGCAFLQSSANYSNLAKEHEFSYFFPSPSSTRTFAAIDDAYDYVRTAHAKFYASSKKQVAKGLAAKLIGPKVTGGQPVTVSYFMFANDEKGEINLADTSRSLESKIEAAISAVVVFLVFYEDKGVAIPFFHLQSGYTYNTQMQIQQYTFNSNNYDTEYPVGWGVDKAFNYLRGDSAGAARQSKTSARYMLVNVDTLNVRSGPSADDALVGQLPRDTRVQVLDSSGTWWKIRAGKVEGYVNSSFLRGV